MPYSEPTVNWNCHYGHYESKTDRFTYVVTKQWRRGELMWFAFMHTHEEDEDQPIKEVPGLLPLNRREAMHNCEEHAKEYSNG